MSLRTIGKAIKNRGAATMALVAASASPYAAAEVFQAYDYTESAVYPVRTGLGITTQIELDPNEEVLDYSTGFSSGWELTRRENVFYLKPKNVDVDTNMLVRTVAHSYVFELKVVATDWTSLEQAKQAGVQYKIAFRYPGGTEFEAKQEQTGPVLSAAIEKGRDYNFDYDYSTRAKQSWLVPASVYDDGRFTYLQLKDLKQLPTGNFPAVFGRKSEGGEDFLVNTTVENDTLVVHGTYPYLVIRHGNQVVGLRRNTRK